MRTLPLICFFLFPLFLQAQLIFSHQIDKSGLSNALDVDVWGQNYLIRTSDVTSRPLDFTDYLIFVNEEGVDINRASLNPYAQESDNATTNFTILTDSSAVALASGSDTGGRTSLIRFDQNGEVTLDREFADVGFVPYSLSSAGDSMIFLVETGLNEERGTFIVHALNVEFEDVYSLKFEEIVEGQLTFNTIHAHDDGSLHIVYERRRDPPGQGTDLQHFVAKVDGNGELLSTNKISGLVVGPSLPARYTAILPVGNEGFALLEGFDAPDIACAGSACTPENGFLRIYRGTTLPAEVYNLNFSPFGMELLPDGNLFVYGTTSFLGNNGKGVLFNPTGWSDGNRIHLLEDPATANLEQVSYNSIYGMSVAGNGDLIGVGVVGYGDGTTNGTTESHWLFRMGANGCFTEDCSDLIANPGDLVPVTDLGQEVSVRTYPNPFTTQLNFAPTENQSAVPVQITLRDVTGRLLKGGTLGAGLQWSTNDLVSGMYIATFTSGAQSATVKLVKQ